MPGLETLDARSLVTRIADMLRAEIMAGSMQPGQRLAQDDLSATLGVSRTPLREAFRLLEVEGWVVSQPRAGYVVAALSVSEVEELAFMRLLLEPFAVRMAAVSHGPDDEARAQRMLDAAPGHITTREDFDKVEALNQDFHFVLYGFDRDLLPESLVTTSKLFWNRYMRYRGYYWESATRVTKAQRAHDDIFDSWRAGDAETAERELAIHILHGVRQIVACLEPEATLSTPLQEMARKYSYDLD